MNALEELVKTTRTRPEQLKETKKNGVKLVGFMGSFVSEEMIMLQAQPLTLFAAEASRNRPTQLFHTSCV